MGGPPRKLTPNLNRLAGGDDNTTSPAAPMSQCVDFILAGSFDEDISVEDISVTPPGAFKHEDSSCNAPLCVGHVFPKGAGSCAVGINWNPATGISDGTVELTLDAICTTRSDADDAQLKVLRPAH